MGKDNNRDSSEVLAKLLGERQNSIVVHPNEFLVVVRDGLFQSDGSLQLGAELTIIRTEGKHTIYKSELFVKKPDIEALLANGSPHTLEFWTPSPDEIDVNFHDSHIIPIVSKDGKIIPIQITIIVAIDPDQAPSLFRLPSIRNSGRVTVDNLQKMLNNNLMANVVAPTIETYNADEIRGNESIRAKLLQKLIDTSETYFDWYGIGLTGNKMTIQWGLTEEEINLIKERKLAWENRIMPKDKTNTESSEVIQPVNVGSRNVFVNSGVINSQVTIDQSIQGGMDVRIGPQGSIGKTNIFRVIISVIGIVGAIGSGIIFIIRILEII